MEGHFKKDINFDLNDEKSISEFKEDLFGYELTYTENLYNALVDARKSDVNATKLDNLIKTHNNGSYRDDRVILDFDINNFGFYILF